MKALITIVFLFYATLLKAQQGFAFTRFSTEDNSGLASNVVFSLYQDEKGFIWVGTANGLQRFDGTKFIQFGIGKPGNDPMPYSAITQIIPADSGSLILGAVHIREFGIFNPVTFTYKKIAVKTSKPLSPRADFHIWKDSKGEVYLNVSRYGILHYRKSEQAFIDDHPFPFPAGYIPTVGGECEDIANQLVWFACEKGFCVFDRKTRQVWTTGFNPKQLGLLNNIPLQDHPAGLYIDKKRRFWITAWPLNNKGKGGQYKYCLDSTGTRFLEKDTAGLHTGPTGYNTYNYFFEPRKSGFWVYGNRVLFNWDETAQRFQFIPTNSNSGNNVEYEEIHQLLEDRDGNLWLASDKGLFFTSYGSGTYSVVNYLFKNEGENNINDILEMPGGDFWFASWGKGIIAIDSSFKEKFIPVCQTPQVPATWSLLARNSVRLAWSLWYQKNTGNVLVGCNYGVLLVYHPVTKITDYLFPPECDSATIRFITADKKGAIWLGTQRGRLLKWADGKFTVVQDVGTIIYKIFIDTEGLIWLATQENGLFCLDADGKLIKHYLADGTPAGLYTNTGTDIEQLNDSIIVYGAGALNFINKKTKTVRLLRYEDGLPSNSVYRLRMDKEGFLWMMTANGLSRYNPYKNRITTYGRKDGITLASQTNTADYYSGSKYIMFGGGNAVVMFKPSLFVTSQSPPDVVITDFKIVNQFLPVDSLQQLPQVKLSAEHNSFSIYFSSLSYQQRDRLTYFFKMEGIDKDWQTADGITSQNYSLLPPGTYTFKVYAVNVEGVRSAHTAELHILIKPHFWRTKWFMSTIGFFILLIIYFLHKERVDRLLAVEKIRNRVARDLHDDMGSTLSTINILSAMAKSKMSSDVVKTASYLSKISDNSQRMMEAMDDIVWSIKPSNDSMQRITARMREFATSVLEAKEMALHFAVADEVADVKLNMESRRDFFLIFKEALNNAAKYSKATEVWVAIATEGRQLSFLIKDNGKGFDVAKADGGNGLGNMQKRADAVNGRLKIVSKEGEGTTVKLTMPVG